MASRRRVLEQQAARIETVLAQHKVKARVTGGFVTPRAIRFDVQPDSARRTSDVDRLSGELAVALGAREARVLHEGNAVQVEIPRGEPSGVQLLPLVGQMQSAPDCTALLGVDSDGAPLLIRLPSSEVAHILITGAVGCGKSALARTILLSLAMFQPKSELSIVLVDAKGGGLAPLAGLPHVLGDVASGPAAMSDCLHWLAGEMEKRELERVDEPRLIVAIDELTDLFAQCGQSARTVVERLARRGRDAGIHLVICAQESPDEWRVSALNDLFPVRASGYGLGHDDPRNAAGVAEGDSARPRARGTFLLVTRGGTIRFQSAWAGRADLTRIEQALCDAGDTRVNWAALDRTSVERFEIARSVDKADPAHARAPEGPLSLWERLRRSRKRSIF